MTRNQFTLGCLLSATIIVLGSKWPEPSTWIQLFIFFLNGFIFGILFYDWNFKDEIVVKSSKPKRK